MVGRQTPLLALFVPLVLVFIVDGGAASGDPGRRRWSAASRSRSRSSSRPTTSPTQLTDIVASLAGAAGAVVLLLRVWQPAEPLRGGRAELVAVGGGTAATARDRCRRRPHGDPGPAGGDHRRTRHRPRSDEPVGAGGIAVAAIRISETRPRCSGPTRRTSSSSRSSASPRSRRSRTCSQDRPSLRTGRGWTWSDGQRQAVDHPHVQASTGCSAAGTLLIIAGLITIPVLGHLARPGAARLPRHLPQLRSAIITVMAVLALAYVMNASGPDRARWATGWPAPAARSPSSRRSSAGSASR